MRDRSPSDPTCIPSELDSLESPFVQRRFRLELAAHSDDLRVLRLEPFVV